MYETKGQKTEKVDWEVPERLADLVKAYSEYISYSETEVIEYYLGFIQEDEKFHSWALQNRNNKKLLKLLEIEEKEEPWLSNNLKRLATFKDAIVEVDIPITSEELNNRAKDYLV